MQLIWELDVYKTRPEATYHRSVLRSVLVGNVSSRSPASGGGQSARLTLGAGYSNFTMDWGPSHRSDGISAWLDYYPFDGAAKNLGIEAEGRTSQWRNPIPQLREDTG